MSNQFKFCSGMDLRCTAWDSYADKFESFLITRPYKEVNICILRVWRIDRELGNINSLNKILSCSLIYMHKLY